MQEASHNKLPMIGLAGRARVGKDTVAAILHEIANYRVASFAEPLRQFVCQITGIPRPELDDVKEQVIPWLGKSPRQLLQTLGTEWGRAMVKDTIWIDVCMKQAEGQRVVITDVRFDNEADAIRARGGVIIHVVRPDALQVASHASEAGVTRFDMDHVIINDGTMKDLRRKVDDTLFTIWRKHAGVE